MGKMTAGFQKMVDAARETVAEISIDELNDIVANSQEKLCLVDVREDYEWDEGHIFDALHLSKGLLEFLAEKYLTNKDAKIILYCRGGHRSLLAAKNLQEMGYTQVKSLQGGITAWVDAGLEIDGELLPYDEHVQMLEDQMNPLLLGDE